MSDGPDNKTQSDFDSQLSLFPDAANDSPGYNIGLHDDSLPRKKTALALSERLASLASKGVYLGTSSWKYQGWIGQIYSAERYLAGRRFSTKRFESECLAEYAETFPTVCGDFAFYQFPSAAQWNRLFSQVPGHFRFTFKVPEEITVRSFPNHPRYGGRAGSANPNFLDAELLQSEFLDLLLPHSNRTPFLIFEFGTSAGDTSPRQFFRTLATFLSRLPSTFRYAVEVRNREFLQDDYFRLLNELRVAHVFNSWTRMPPLTEQLRLEDAFTTDFTVCRALLKPGRDYADAVQRFSPYRAVQEPNEEVRNALRDLLVRAKGRAEPTFLFVNNRLEGNAPQTIEAVVGLE